jgi:hypothetical protein
VIVVPRQLWLHVLDRSNAAICRLESELRAGCDEQARAIGTEEHTAAAPGARGASAGAPPCAASAVQHRFASEQSSSEFDKQLARYHARIVRLYVTTGWVQHALDYMAKVPAAAVGTHRKLLHEVNKHGDLECLRVAKELQALLGLQVEECASLYVLCQHQLCCNVVATGHEWDCKRQS